MEERITNQMQMVINNTIAQMEKLVNDIETNIDKPTNFNLAIRTFNNAAAELISFISNPAIRVVDTSGKSHFMVGGEKWKLFMTINLFYSLNGDEGVREIVCTNPVDLKCDKFIISKTAAIEALRNYESLYDTGIQHVMTINAEAGNLINAATNPEKVEVLRKTVGLIKEAMASQLSFYDAVKKGS